MKVSIGIDWADQRHAICLREYETRRILAEFEIAHTVAGLARLEEVISTLGGSPEDCVVAIETNQGLLVNYLFEAGYRIHPIPTRNTFVNEYRMASDVVTATRSVRSTVGPVWFKWS